MKCTGDGKKVDGNCSDFCSFVLRTSNATCTSSSVPLPIFFSNIGIKTSLTVLTDCLLWLMMLINSSGRIPDFLIFPITFDTSLKYMYPFSGCFALNGLSNDKDSNISSRIEICDIGSAGEKTAPL
jgi:hypothetical protein